MKMYPTVLMPMNAPAASSTSRRFSRSTVTIGSR